MGRKVGAVPFLGGAGTTSNTMLPRPRTTSVPSGIFINPCSHFATTDIGGKLGAVPPFLSWIPIYTMWPGPRPISMPSFILIHSTVWPTSPTNRHTGEPDKQRTDSIRQTVLQMVAQKSHHCIRVCTTTTYRTFSSNPTSTCSAVQQRYTYIIIPASNETTRHAELTNVRRWDVRNNLQLNCSKSTKVIFRDHRRRRHHMQTQPFIVVSSRRNKRARQGSSPRSAAQSDRDATMSQQKTQQQQRQQQRQPQRQRLLGKSTSAATVVTAARIIRKKSVFLY